MTSGLETLVFSRSLSNAYACPYAFQTQHARDRFPEYRRDSVETTRERERERDLGDTQSRSRNTLDSRSCRRREAQVAPHRLRRAPRPLPSREQVRRLARRLRRVGLKARRVPQEPDLHEQVLPSDARARRLNGGIDTRVFSPPLAYRMFSRVFLVSALLDSRSRSVVLERSTHETRARVRARALSRYRPKSTRLKPSRDSATLYTEFDTELFQIDKSRSRQVRARDSAAGRASAVPLPWCRSRARAREKRETS